VLHTNEYKGMWWLADQPDQLRPGTLTVAKGKGELEVLGHFTPCPVQAPDETPRVFDFADIGEPRRIVGRTATNESITLEGAYVAPFPGDISTYNPPWVLVGRAFGPDEKIAFADLIVELTDLDTWTGRSGFTRSKREADLPDHRLAGLFDIEFKQPESIELELDGGEEVSIDFSVRHSGWTPVPTSVTVSQAASLSLRFAEPHGLGELARRVGQLRNFFSLAVGRPISVLSVTAHPHHERRTGMSQPAPIKLLWEIPHNPEPPENRRHPATMAFTLTELPNGLGDALKTWFGMQERFRPVFDLYFGMRYHPDIFGELRFLAHAQAIESYDRRRRSTGSAIDQRLRATLKRCPNVRASLLKAGGMDLDEFLTAFEDSRNYYTHYTSGPKENSQARRGVLLYVLTLQLQTVIEMLLLRHLDFSDDEIDTILSTRLERYREIANAKAQASAEDLVVPQE
jgi:hypothetical protein